MLSKLNSVERAQILKSYHYMSCLASLGLHFLTSKVEILLYILELLEGSNVKKLLKCLAHVRHPMVSLLSKPEFLI